MSPIDICKIARNLSWIKIPISGKTDEYMLSFTKGNARINVYPTKMTVGTVISHPFKGRTQLHRKNVSEEELVKIFKNPRQHTGKGYYQKDKKGSSWYHDKLSKKQSRLAKFLYWLIDKFG